MCKDSTENVQRYYSTQITGEGSQKVRETQTLLVQSGYCTQVNEMSWCARNFRNLFIYTAINVPGALQSMRGLDPATGSFII